MSGRIKVEYSQGLFRHTKALFEQATRQIVSLLQWQYSSGLFRHESSASGRQIKRSWKASKLGKGKTMSTCFIALRTSLLKGGVMLRACMGLLGLGKVAMLLHWV